jgi:hypothetical protein
VDTVVQQAFIRVRIRSAGLDIAEVGIVPFAVNVPIACGGVLVMPRDIVVANNDGAVNVTAALAPQLVERASQHAEWEAFSRTRLAEGGDLRRYYPLSKDAEPEYEKWKAAHHGHSVA